MKKNKDTKIKVFKDGVEIGYLNSRFARLIDHNDKSTTPGNRNINTKRIGASRNAKLYSNGNAKGTINNLKFHCSSTHSFETEIV